MDNPLRGGIPNDSPVAQHSAHRLHDRSEPGTAALTRQRPTVTGHRSPLNGTTTHPIDFTGCGTAALQEHLQEIHDTEEAQRHSDADTLSADIDPFNQPVDLVCDD
jgi:hypothetical protein